MIRPLSPRARIPAQRRRFLLATLGLLSQSSWYRTVRAVDAFESDTPTSTSSSPASAQFAPKLPDGRILISPIERAILFTVSGVSGILHPEAGYHINNFGEASALESVLRAMRDQMLSTVDGRRILRERPQLNGESMDTEWLQSLPSNTLGHHYAQFTQDNDDRAPVKFIADEELAYVFVRYRQMHDIVHILTKSKVDLAGELPVKAFEFGNTGLPMTGLACLAWFKLSDKRKKRVNMVDSFLLGLSAKPLIAMPWEQLMEHDVEELRQEIL